MEWRVRVGDDEYVAASTEVLQEWYGTGRVRAEHYVLHPVLNKWMYAGEVQELRAALAAMPLNVTGAWCPNCRNRNSYQSTGGVLIVVIIIAIISCGLGLIMIPFLPKTWHCNVCGNQWRG